MTEADTGTPPPAEAPSPADGPPPAPTRSEAALAAYRTRLRRARIVYTAVVGAVVVALVVVTAVVLSRGEAAHATLHTFAAPPPSLSLAEPGPALQLAWRTTDRLALGTPQSGGTVVTYSQHTVGGRDARTGRRTWSYTRTDRTICTAAQTAGTTMVVYELHGNCDQVGAFDSATGRRRWTRTLDKDQRPLDGHPTYQVQPFAFMLTTPNTIYALDPVTGYNGWNYYRYGCRIESAVLGSSGALISQTCGPSVRCKGIKFCTHGPQLVLRDGSAGTADNGDNRDRIKWLQRGTPGVPVSADGIVSTLGADGRTLTVLAADTGKPQRTVDLGSAGSSATTAVPIANTELIFRDGTTYAVDNTADKPAWTATTSGPPTAVSTTGDAPTNVAAVRVTAAAGGSVVSLGGADGRVAQRFAADAPTGAVVYPMGTGFLVGAPAGAVAYR